MTEPDLWPVTVEGIGPPPCTYRSESCISTINEKKNDGEVETPAMDPNNNYKEEAPVSMASRSADDENDSNPPGRSSFESAFLKTRGRCLKIGTWNVRTLYQPGCNDVV